MTARSEQSEARFPVWLTLPLQILAAVVMIIGILVVGGICAILELRKEPKS